MGYFLTTRIPEAASIARSMRLYFARHEHEIRRRLPREWACEFPAGCADPVGTDVVNEYLIAPWILRIEAARATMRYAPAGGIARRGRVWFEIELIRDGDGWRVVDGVRLKQASARR